MSYSEYLSRKKHASPVILNTVKPTDSSMFTLKTRQMASRVFAYNSNYIGTTLESNDGYNLKSHAPKSHVKSTGRPADSSSYTSHIGARAINNNSAETRGKILTNSNDAGSYSKCVPIPAPVSHLSASDFTRTQQCCEVPGIPLFVDNTIRLAEYDNCERQRQPVIRVVKDKVQRLFVPRNCKTPVLPYQNGNAPPYKAGKAIANIPYIEKHHGNDLSVNPERPFVKYQGNGPPILKINNPNTI